MYPISEKHVCQLYYIVKGHLTDMKTMEECYDGYFKRMWGNHETCYRLEGFEEAYAAYQKKKKVDSL